MDTEKNSKHYQQQTNTTKQRTTTIEIKQKQATQKH